MPVIHLLRRVIHMAGVNKFKAGVCVCYVIEIINYVIKLFLKPHAD